MMPSELFAICFLLASAGCVAAGMMMWGVLLACRRRLPAMALQRSVWLAGQAVVALTFLALLAPQAAPLQVLPAFDVDVTAAVVSVAASTSTGDTSRNPVSPSGAPTSWLGLAAQAWLLAWSFGVVAVLARLWQGQRTLDRLVRLGARMPATPGAPDTVEVDLPIPPMLVGVLRPRLLLPLALRAGDPLQRELIVAHELTHWRRRDMWWLAAATVLQLLFWFNPAMRLLRRRLAWAQELGCDRDVLAGRPPGQRKAYVAALFGQLQLQRGMPPGAGAVLAFGGVDPDSLASRVALIRAPAASGAARARWMGLAALALVAGASLALQPALAWTNKPPRALDCTIMLDAASGARLVEEGDCGVRATPASTFNIAVSLMGYDSGFLRDAHAPALPFKPGYADWLPSWRATTDPSAWIHNSTVWYAQQVTAQLGERRLAAYLARFGYGNGDLSGGAQQAWITSSLQISPREQTDFLRRVVNRELALSAHAYDMTAQLLQLPQAHGGWTVHGKTGTAFPLLADGSEDPRHAWGWFVGWASREGRTVVFARLLLDRRQDDRSAGPALKESFLRELPSRLAALHDSGGPRHSTTLTEEFP